MWASRSLDEILAELCLAAADEGRFRRRRTDGSQHGRPTLRARRPTYAQQRRRPVRRHAPVRPRRRSPPATRRVCDERRATRPPGSSCSHSRGGRGPVRRRLHGLRHQSRHLETTAPSDADASWALLHGTRWHRAVSSVAVMLGVCSTLVDKDTAAGLHADAQGVRRLQSRDGPPSAPPAFDDRASRMRPPRCARLRALGAACTAAAAAFGGRDPIVAPVRRSHASRRRGSLRVRRTSFGLGPDLGDARSRSQGGRVSLEWFEKLDGDFAARPRRSDGWRRTWRSRLSSCASAWRMAADGDTAVRCARGRLLRTRWWARCMLG